MKWKRAISQATFILAFPSVRATVSVTGTCWMPQGAMPTVLSYTEPRLTITTELQSATPQAPEHSGNTISKFLSSCLQSTAHEKSPARNSMSAHAQNIAVSEKLLLAILKASFLQAQNKQQAMIGFRVFTYTWHLWIISTPTVRSSRALTALLDVFSLCSSVSDASYFPPIAAL
jgi:hypothetical protein